MCHEFTVYRILGCTMGIYTSQSQATPEHRGYVTTYSIFESIEEVLSQEQLDEEQRNTHREVPLAVSWVPLSQIQVITMRGS